MEMPERFRLDRGALEVVSLTDRPNNRACRLSKTPAERWEALELRPQIACGYDPANERLQKVLEIVELETR
jgi:hypothetical protein